MLRRLTLKNRIFGVTVLLLFISFLLVWIFVRPEYRDQIIKERSVIVSQLQEYSLREVDGSIREWLNTTNYVAEELIQRPAEAEALVRRAIGLTPNLMRIIIEEVSSGETIDIKRTIYSDAAYPGNVNNWQEAEQDPRISVALVPDSTQSADFFITQRALQLSGNIFTLKLFYDASSLLRTLTSLPIDGPFTANVVDANQIDVKTGNYIDFPKNYFVDTGLSNLTPVEVDGTSSYVLTSRLATLNYWHVISIGEDVILQPVQNLIIYSLLAGSGILLIMFMLSWYISAKINRPIATLINDVEYMNKLNFEHSIDKPLLPEFSLMQETLENIRLTLLRYQKLNVEKIILEEWKNRYMMTYSEDLIGILDTDKTFSFVNNHFVEFLEELALNPNKVTLNDVIEKDSIRLSQHNQMYHYPDPFTVKIEQAELSHYINEDTQYFYDYQFLTIIDEQDKEQGALVILHDKTEDRLLDNKRNEMINIIVHELKNPVAGIVGLTNLMMDNLEMPREEQKVLLREVNTAGERMNELVNRFLDVQRLESGRQDVEKTRLDLEDIVMEVLAISKPLLSAKNLKVDLNKTKKDFYIMGSRELVFDAIQNLVSNAVKYGDKNRTIELAISKKEETVEFSCTDYGYGISVEDQQKIFEKFYRVKSNAKSAGEKGTGLGLAYVKEIMARHSGEILLESNSQIGSRFTLIFPAYKSITLEKA